MDHPVLFICGDPSGYNFVHPIHKAAKANGMPAVLVADGYSVNRCVEARQSFRFYATVQDMLDELTPAAVVTSMCCKGGIGAQVVKALRGKVPTIGLNALWGVIEDPWMEPEHRPDYIVVNDAIGAECFNRAYGYFEDRIKQLGYAALDRFAAFDTGKANIEAQQALRASGRDFVVLYTGMWNGHTQGLEAAAQACEILRDQRAVPVTLIAREHPRMRRDFPDAVAAWEQATNHYKVAAAILDTSAVLNTDYLIALAHVVVSTTSSTLMEASVLGRPNIAYLNPEILADYERDTHGLLKEFPLVTLGCTARAGNILELAGLIERALTDRSLGLEEAQRRVFRLDGKNAERCVEFLQGLLKR